MLKKGAFNFEFIAPDNIDEQILLIKNYPKHQRSNKVNFAFSLQNFIMEHLILVINAG